MFCTPQPFCQAASAAKPAETEGANQKAWQLGAGMVAQLEPLWAVFHGSRAKSLVCLQKTESLPQVIVQKRQSSFGCLFLGFQMAFVSRAYAFLEYNAISGPAGFAEGIG